MLSNSTASQSNDSHLSNHLALGFSLVETLISLVLLSLIISSVSQVLVKSEMIRHQSEWESLTQSIVLSLQEAQFITKNTQFQLSGSVENIPVGNASETNVLVRADNAIDNHKCEWRVWQEYLQQHFPKSQMECVCERGLCYAKFQQHAKAKLEKFIIYPNNW